MYTLHRTCLFFAVLLLPHIVMGQEAPSDNPEIVVTGSRTTDDEVVDFVNNVIRIPSSGQLSRFNSGVCPQAVGLQPSQKQAVVQRLRAIAKAVEIEVDAENRIPNVVLIVTCDKHGLMQTLAQRHRKDYFHALPTSEVRKLVESREHAVAWHIDGLPRNADGQPLQYDGGFGTYVNRTSRPASRIGLPTRPTFALALVVVESSALDGLTTTQLADYAAMRAFVRTDAPTAAISSAPTILKVLDTPMAAAMPVSLTH